MSLPSKLIMTILILSFLAYIAISDYQLVSDFNYSNEPFALTALVVLKIMVLAFVALYIIENIWL